MKRNEFKLLLEDWKRNFIVESGLPSNDELKDDIEGYFDDGSFEEPGLDDLGHPSHMHSPDDEFLDSDMDSLDHGGHSFPSLDTHSQQSFAQYPGDDEFDSAEFDHDYSSIGGDDIDDLLPEIDEMGDDDYGF